MSAVSVSGNKENKNVTCQNKNAQSRIQKNLGATCNKNTNFLVN